MTFLSQRWFRWASARGPAPLAWCFGGFPSKSCFSVVEPSNSGPSNSGCWVIHWNPDSRRFNPFLSHQDYSLLKMHQHPLHWGWNWAPGVLNILRPCLVGCWWDVDFTFSLLWRGAYSTLNHSCGGDIIPNLSGFESSCYTTKNPMNPPDFFTLNRLFCWCRVSCDPAAALFPQFPVDMGKEEFGMLTVAYGCGLSHSWISDDLRSSWSNCLWKTLQWGFNMKRWNGHIHVLHGWGRVDVILCHER